LSFFWLLRARARRNTREAGSLIASTMPVSTAGVLGFIIFVLSLASSFET
jgi:hypothetical protein